MSLIEHDIAVAKYIKLFTSENSSGFSDQPSSNCTK